MNDLLPAENNDGQALPLNGPDLLFAPYDSLLVRGPLEHVLKLTAQNGLALQAVIALGILF